MIANQKIVVVMPAYNAERTLERTFSELPHDVLDDVILTDDGSSDRTRAIAQRLGITTIEHERNLGYGANQKTCYSAALSRGADIVVMVHPDYQYSPKLVMPMAAMIASGHFDVVLGSRILGRGAVRQGAMPVYKYLANRTLTLIENIMLGVKLSEFHTGLRAWSRKLLETLPLMACSDDFVFDNQMLAQAIYFGFGVGEISCPARYMPEASSMNFRRSVGYGFGVLKTSLEFRLQRAGLAQVKIFQQGHDDRLCSGREAHGGLSRVGQGTR
jgi:glycosyltransferase involved in cell wall biosynthesis